MEALQAAHAVDRAKVETAATTLNGLQGQCKDTCGRHNVVLAHVLAALPMHSRATINTPNHADITVNKPVRGIKAGTKVHSELKVVDGAHRYPSHEGIHDTNSLNHNESLVAECMEAMEGKKPRAEPPSSTYIVESVSASHVDASHVESEPVTTNCGAAESEHVGAGITQQRSNPTLP